MLFHEIYGKYFRTVASILRQAAQTGITGREIRELVAHQAFAESGMTIPDALRSGKWPLLDENGETVLLGIPEMPLTTLEKRWLKSLLLDPRIALFDPPTEGLEDVPPLYDPKHIVWFDRYTDGDPYTDPHYIRIFHALRRAIRENSWVTLAYDSYKGTRWELRCRPICLEYSEKDDKFRIRVRSPRGAMILNLARIHACEPGCPSKAELPALSSGHRELVLELEDRRNTLERALLAFSYLKKETIRLEGDRYRLKLWYPADDETEILIRVQSFGPTLKVLSPDSFVENLRIRLQKQKRLRTP